MMAGPLMDTKLTRMESMHFHIMKISAVSEDEKSFWDDPTALDVPEGPNSPRSQFIGLAYSLTGRLMSPKFALPYRYIYHIYILTGIHTIYIYYI